MRLLLVTGGGRRCASSSEARFQTRALIDVSRPSHPRTTVSSHSPGGWQRTTRCSCRSCPRRSLHEENEQGFPFVRYTAVLRPRSIDRSLFELIGSCDPSGLAIALNLRARPTSETPQRS